MFQFLRGGPLISYTLAFLAGQYFNSTYSLVCGMLLLVAPRLRTYMPIYAFLAGALVALASLPYQDDLRALPDSPFAGTVLSPIRRIRVGEIRFPFYVTHYNEGTWRTLDRPRTLYCRAQDLPWKNSHDVYPGSKRAALVAVDRKVRSPKRFGNCEVLALTKDLGGSPSVIYRARRYLLHSMRKILGGGEASALMEAILLGRGDGISWQTKKVFRDLGLAHLLVVSGYHLGIFFSTSYFLLYTIASYGVLKGYIFVARWPAVAGGVILTLFYALLCGHQPSLHRALLAMTIVAIALLLGKKNEWHVSLALSALFLMVIWPRSFLEPGVQLTFVALIGIAIGSRLPIKNRLLAYFSLHAVVHVATSLVSLFWFDHFSVVGLFVNALLAPLLAMLCCNLGIIALSVYVIGLDRSGYLLLTQHWLLEKILLLLTWMSELPWVSFDF